MAATTKKRPRPRPRSKRSKPPASVPGEVIMLRLPPELVQRIDRLMPSVMSDENTATMLGRLSRSALFRLVALEGLKHLERRYAIGANT